jgi:YD repeat-containing protein
MGMATLLLLQNQSSARASSSADFARAEAIRAFDDRTLGGIIFPHWLPSENRFTYVSYDQAEKPGFVFLVDAKAASKRALFDTRELATSLSRASGTVIDFNALPVWRLGQDEKELAAFIAGRSYLCSLSPMTCRVASNKDVKAIGISTEPSWATRSPDGKWDAFVWNHNLYIRPASLSEDNEYVPRGPSISEGSANNAFGTEFGYYFFQPTGQRGGCDLPAPAGAPVTAAAEFMPVLDGSIALTSDGGPLYSYGPRWKGGAEVATLDTDRYRPTKAAIVWSPDSKKLSIRRSDLRGVGVYPLYSSTSNQPIDHSYYYAGPGSKNVPQYDLYVADIATRTTKKSSIPSNGLVLQPEGERWTADSKTLLAISAERGLRSATLYSINPDTGLAKPTIHETSKTYVRTDNSLVAVTASNGEIFWFSERDGWGHIYRYDAKGKLLNQVDTGRHVVSQIIHIDENKNQIYFTARGRDVANPYYRHLLRINFDGSGLKDLTPASGDHDVQLFPGGKFFLDIHQDIATPPTALIRSIDGSLVQVVSQGRDAALRAIGWRPAQEFSVKARDGVTDLYGVMYRPSTFDPSKKYPLIVNVYPLSGSVGTIWRFEGGDNNLRLMEGGDFGITHGEGMDQALAELGFIVIKLNSLGTPGRQRAFQDFAYGNVIDNGLPDQIAAIGQLASRHSFIDQDRVGIFGHSGGGFATAAGMLIHPDMFKVGVAQAGNHDFRNFGWYWGEMFQGLVKNKADEENYAKQAALTYAANLKGKLLLIHGDMDCNVSPSNTLRLYDALIREGKSVDLSIIPDAGHQLPTYAMHQSWSYFVNNLKMSADK